MSPLRYSEKQILCGIAEQLCLGPDLLVTRPPLKAEVRIDHYLQSLIPTWVDEEIEISDFFAYFQYMEYYFRFKSSHSEWSEYFKLNIYKADYEKWEEFYAADFTFGRLAQFIAARATAISFQPVEVLGTECGPAGAFYGLQGLVKSLKKRSPDFGPSTRIRDVLKGDSVVYFWSQLRGITEQGVVELPAGWRYLQVTAFASLICFTTVVAVLISLLKLEPVYIASIFAVVPVGMFAVWIYQRWSNPLPSDLQTFRDLAVLIANLDCEAVWGSNMKTDSAGKGLT
ncbi:hypothetical protein [Gimesia sp.]|uniref:hypothetical protein n=1 Tax=Gimesia sp. TaxID=2024833 RepID=UPI003A931384